MVELHPTEYINDPFRIAQNDRMVAINSAIEVDLTGQVCADSIGPRIYSGVGGQVDFIYGASRSKGGKPIIALPSTATVKGQPVSRIVADAQAGRRRGDDAQSCPLRRHRARHRRSLRQVPPPAGPGADRRGAIPQFRDELEKAAQELH